MDAITIENANKIRASMGLAPLPMPASNGGGAAPKPDVQADEADTTSTLEHREAAAGDNWRRLEDERRATADRAARKEALKKQRDLEQRNKVLIGKGLADSDDDDDDGSTRAWLLGQKARQKKIDAAAQREAERVAAEAARQKQISYGAKDLAGIKVGHELDAFDGEEQILTLKDAEIGEDDGEDELEAADLVDKERTKRNNDLKRGRPVYDPTEDDNGEQSLLKQYDDEDEAKKKRRFTLDASGGGAKPAAASNSDKTAGRVKISLDLLQDDTPISDYAELKMKKPRKTKNKTARKKALGDDDGPSESHLVPADTMAIDEPSTTRSSTVVDEDEKAIQQAKKRRETVKQRKKPTAAELARQLKEETVVAPPSTTAEDDEPGMVLDETSEFVANLKRPGEESDSEAERRAKRAPTKPSTPAAAVADPDGDTIMASALDERDAALSRIPHPADDDDDDDDASKDPSNNTTNTGFEAEETLDNGVAASLNLLRKRGVIKESTDPDAVLRDRARVDFLAQNKALVDEYDIRAREDRERDRRSGRFDRMSAAERDAYQRKQNESREAYLAGLRNKHYAMHYRPDVRLKYTDEFGRDMNAREAFKHLSHVFHGKGSGKQKVEKMLKKVEDEKRAAAKSVLDAGNEGGMRNAMGQQARKNNTAGVRLQ